MPLITEDVQSTEERRLSQALAFSHYHYSGLLGACRAAVAADALGHPDPLFWIREELASHGQLPSPDALPEQVAAVSGHDSAPH